MDPVQMGKFLARLRKEAGMTQEALGQTLGVTNKTVSRWENGNYLPDLDILQLLGARFGVSVDELIQGRRTPAQTAQDTLERPETERAVTGQTALSQTDGMQTEPGQAAPPQVDTAGTSAHTFALTERIAYWKRKWLREHLAALVLCYALLCALLPVAAAVLDLSGNVPLFIGGWVLLTLVFYLTARNRMMIYVEVRAFLP